jgi:toxin ParE1/3/4
MRRKRTITFAASAIKDLEALRTWYTGQQVPAVGERLIKEVIAQIEKLAGFPESWCIMPEFGIANLREVLSYWMQDTR